MNGTRKGMKLYFNGKEMLGELIDVAYEMNLDPSEVRGDLSLKASTTWVSVSTIVPISRRSYKELRDALLRPRAFKASFETLMRRASYGGRKGRRALRRLMAMEDYAWREGLK